MATMADREWRADSGWSIGRAVKWLVIGTAFFLTLATLATHETYLLRPGDPLLKHLATFRWWLIPHVAGGTIAFLTAPFQFSLTLHRRYPTAHRWIGRVYMMSVIVSSILSVYIVLRYEVQANWWVMGTMGGLWLLTTVFAWLAILNRNLAQHQLWIGRSFGLTFTFVLTRVVPDQVFPGMDYVKQTALYWAFIVASLIVPDLVVNGRALSLRWMRR